MVPMSAVAVVLIARSSWPSTHCSRCPNAGLFVCAGEAGQTAGQHRQASGEVPALPVAPGSHAPRTGGRNGSSWSASRAVLPNLHGCWLAMRPSGYFTVSNSSESETPNALASRNRFLKEGFRRAVSIPPKYVRCIWANSAKRS
jgi:hypothetical protein